MGIGVAATGGGALLRVALMDQLGERLVYLTLYPAVEIAALIGGFASGGVAAVLCALLAHFWIAPLVDHADWIGLAFFLISSTILSLVTEALHRTWVRFIAADAKDFLP